MTGSEYYPRLMKVLRSIRSTADPNAYGDAFTEYRQFSMLGVNGVFSDVVDTAVARPRRIPHDRAHR